VLATEPSPSGGRLLRSWLLGVALALIGASGAASEGERPSRKLDVWYVPTTQPVIDRMLKMAKVHPLDVVYDLGCGDGRMVIAAAKQYGARGVGVDLDPRRIREARANAKAAGVEKLVTFRVGDLFETDLREADVVLLYLLPELNRRLKPKLFAELKPGARVVSHDFDMGRNWPAHEYVKLGQDGIYLWVMPPTEDRSPAP
jgi:SAM-dependent methyltransferase